jgi:hypothetical protein
VARCLLKEIIPQFRIPVSIGSDNGPDFVAKVVQLMARALGITWKLHMTYHPQSSRKVEHMTRTLKLQLGKLSGDPSAVRPIALWRIRSSPTKWTRLSPLKSFMDLIIVPTSLIKGIQGDLREIGDLTMRQQIQTLGLTLSKINHWVWERLSISLTTPTHPFRPGDAIWVHV